MQGQRSEFGVSNEGQKVLESVSGTVLPGLSVLGCESSWKGQRLSRWNSSGSGTTSCTAARLASTTSRSP
eukprot:1144775-Amphidinium_carterae.1